MKLLPILAGLLALAGCSSSPPKPTAPQSSAPAAPPSVEALQAAYEKSASEYNASKGDSAKAAYVSATVAYATAVMAGEGPPAKYRKALKLYDEALKLDPANDEAKTNRQLILDIYKQMGKEPPK